MSVDCTILLDCENDVVHSGQEVTGAVDLHVRHQLAVQSEYLFKIFYSTVKNSRNFN